MLQDDVFSSFEGDQWFIRNCRALGAFKPENDTALILMKTYDLKPRNVLEIGAASGFRLAAIQNRLGSTVVAVEASMEAVINGHRAFPSVKFIRGSAACVPLRGNFDLVIINFVFHWIDRRSLLGVVAEVDRLVNDGGYLIIGDFRPANYIRTRYHHIQGEELFTYKQDYAGIFLASGLYHTVSLLTTHHAGGGLKPAAPEEDRIGTCLLRKEWTKHYYASEKSSRTQ
jgi:SAM-dependent methyltransferase